MPFSVLNVLIAIGLINRATIIPYEIVAGFSLQLIFMEGFSKSRNMDIQNVLDTVVHALSLAGIAVAVFVGLIIVSFTLSVTVTAGFAFTLKEILLGDDDDDEEDEEEIECVCGECNIDTEADNESDREDESEDKPGEIYPIAFTFSSEESPNNGVSGITLSQMGYTATPTFMQQFTSTLMTPEDELKGNILGQYIVASSITLDSFSHLIDPHELAEQVKKCDTEYEAACEAVKQCRKELIAWGNVSNESLSTLQKAKQNLITAVKASYFTPNEEITPIDE